MIGETLSHFRITAKLGEGGMGEVWAAQDIDLERPVALKVLSKEILAREDMRARFLREARTAASLNHPNICTIHEVGEVEGVPFIAMERIEGDGLDRRLAGVSQLSVTEILRIAIQISEAMAAAHSRGVVHRDLKPANVMLTPEGQVKMLDFGLAKPVDLPGEESVATEAPTITAEMTREGTILGTVSYMSPEQVQAKPVDARTDIFSFGVLLYQMVTGRLPFRGETATAILAKILETEPEPPSSLRRELPPDLERILRRCLAKRPADRYNDTRDLVADLRSLQPTGESAVAESPAAARRLVKPWIWLVLLAVVIAGAVWLARLWSKATDVPAEESMSQVAVGSSIPSVAVLPLHNLSGDPENDYFSAGMTEEIISKLARIRGLEVASRSSVAAFTDPARNVQQIGRDLGVLYLLDGSVRRVGDRVRVSAQLVDRETGRVLWSEDFDGTLEDVFAMQEQTALHIADQLDLELTAEEQESVERRSTDNVAAYDAYLRAMAQSRDWGSQSRIERAIAAFEEALAIDPDFAAALAGLATVEMYMYRNHDSSEKRLQLAEQYAKRAVELDPTLADATHAMALLAGMQFDYGRAAELHRKAVSQAPKEPLFWENLSWALSYKTPPDGKAAVEAALEAIRLQPHFPGAYYQLGRGYLVVGRFEEARQAFETMLEQDPDFAAGRMGMAQYHLALAEFDEALAELELDRGRDTTMLFYYKAAALAGLGEVDRAIEALRSAFEKGFRDFAVLESSPYFETVRDDPRFEELVRRYRS